MRVLFKKAERLNSVPPCFSSIGDDQCTGCAACANACSQSAIEMKLNRDGFYRPVLRDDLCNCCDACLKFCPIIAVMENDTRQVKQSDLPEPEVYAAWSTDKEVHMSSSSGGIFSELARHVLDLGGVVCGCMWDKNWTPRHVMIDNWADVSQLRGSKYIPSFVDDRFYRKLISLAETGTMVLFCGTPCQVAGLAGITPHKAKSNLLLVDLVCHGVPSLTSFWRYLDWKFGAKDNLKSFSFRNKEISIQTICAITNAGDKYLASCGEDAWFRAAMVYHLFLQKSCFKCHFSTLPRNGDITLGDFWGIPEQWHDPGGDSVVLAHSNKGKDTLQQLIKKNHIRIQQSDYVTASRKIGRLRGNVYTKPLLRYWSFCLLGNKRTYGFFYRVCYLPLRFKERLFDFILRRVRMIEKWFSIIMNIRM